MSSAHVRAAIAALLVVSCTNPQAAAPGIAGQYVLTAVDGVRGGNISGSLQIGWNVPAGTYELRVALAATDSFTLAGRYVWDGVTLTLRDSASGASVTGHVLDGTQVVVQRGAHSYQFSELFSFPHN